jgi:hypothetical protein
MIGDEHGKWQNVDLPFDWRSTPVANPDWKASDLSPELWDAIRALTDRQRGQMTLEMTDEARRRPSPAFARSIPITRSGSSSWSTCARSSTPIRCRAVWKSGCATRTVYPAGSKDRSRTRISTCFQARGTAGAGTTKAGRSPISPRLLLAATAWGSSLPAPRRCSGLEMASASGEASGSAWSPCGHSRVWVSRTADSIAPTVVEARASTGCWPRTAATQCR